MVNEEELWERAERVTKFVVKTSRAARDGTESGEVRATNESVRPLVSDLRLPSGYTVTTAIADIQSVSQALSVPSSCDSRRTWYLNVLYPLSVAAVANDRKLSLTAKQTIFPDDMNLNLVGVSIETYPEQEGSDNNTQAQRHGIGPAREHTATNIVRRIQHDIRRPSNIARYAGALCCVRWLTGRIDGIGQALPSVVDAIPETPSGSSLRRGAVTSAFFVANWVDSVIPPHEYISPLLIALDDPSVRIRGHSAAAIAEIINPGQYGRGDPTQFCTAADALLDRLASDDCSPVVARTIMNWVCYRDWERLEETVPAAVPENAYERTENAVGGYLESDDEVLRSRAEYIQGVFRRRKG